MDGWNICHTQDPDLRIDPSAMKERDYSNSADTDRYQVNILTEESGRRLQKGGEVQAEAARRLMEGLFSDQNQGRDGDAVLARAESLDIFTSAENLKSMNTVREQPGLPLPAAAGLFLILGLAGYALGRLFQAYKRRKEHVHNDYSTVKG